MSVTDLVSSLEEIMIKTAGVFGIEAGRNPLNRGVWIEKAKLGSIGIAVRKDITFHGMALNINLDLTLFSWINPCGLKDVSMTSLKEAAGKTIDMHAARHTIKENMQTVLDFELEQIRPKELADLIQP